MLPIKAVFLPLGRPTFDLETANRYVEESNQLLQGMVESCIAPESLLISPEDTASFLRGALDHNEIEVLIVQSTTFVDARFIMEIMDVSALPILLWGVREPRVNGTRLSLNSMTGINNLSNSIVSRGRKFALLFGNPTEDALARELYSQLKVIKLADDLKGLKIGVLGKHPDGFFFSGADQELLAKLGPQLIDLDLGESFRRANELREEDIQETLNKVRDQVTSLDRIPAEGLYKFARMQTALSREIERQGISMVAVRCWPEFFTDFGAAACSTVSSFIESGIMASCEADIHGAITMYIQHRLSDSAPYLGDLVHIDESKDSGVFWHCGAGAFSLARKDTGAEAGLHPNRKMGFTLEFGLKAGRVSIHRLGPDPFRPGQYRMLQMGGEALDEPQKFWGTSVEVGFGQPAIPLLKKLLKLGFEPHYSIIYEDVREEMAMLCEWLGIQTIDL